ncbi:MAG: hypothetical protein ACTSYA_01825 [Candidatus Kariarchaeaceae archaeon]
MSEVSTVPQLVCQHLSFKEGEFSGRCVFCGLSSSVGFSLKRIKNSFTAFSHLHVGEIICPECLTLYEDPSFRRRSFFVTRKSFEFLKRGKKSKGDLRTVWEVLVSLNTLTQKELPFALWITESYKKHGWLTMTHNLNYSTKRAQITFEETTLFWVPELAFEMREVADKLLKCVYKKNLLQGHYLPSQQNKILENDLWSEYQKAKNWATNSLWILVVHLI